MIVRPLIARIAGLVGAALLALVLLQSWRLDREQSAHEATKGELRQERADALAFANGVSATSRGIQAAMIQTAWRVERAQVAINEEVSREYQARIADARRRYDALRLRPNSTAGAGAGRGATGLPVLPAASGRADGAAGYQGLSLSERLIATETSIRLEELQGWLTQQLAVDRSQAPLTSGAAPEQRR